MRYTVYKVSTLVLTVAMLGYLVMAEAHEYRYLKDLQGAQSGEVFPFFNWSLFSSPKRIGTRYTVEVAEAMPGSTAEEFEGEILRVADAEFLNEIEFQKTVKYYLQHIARDDQALARIQKKLIDNFLTNFGALKYRVVRIDYDPFEPDTTLETLMVTDTFDVRSTTPAVGG